MGLVKADNTGLIGYSMGENANHNAGAPMPGPQETWAPVPTRDFVPAAHYSDAV